MKAPVERIAVLLLTLPTHREAVHGGKGAVVGQTPHNGVTRAAIGTVDEGVTKAAVFRVEHLPTAIAAKGNIGRYERLNPGTGSRICDQKGLFRNRGDDALLN